MDYEKAYKEALERMKSWMRGEHSECFSEAQKAAEFIFPELKESEDEKIRKEMLDFFNQLEDKKLRGVDISSWIAWLEKQGETENFIDKNLVKEKAHQIAWEISKHYDPNACKQEWCEMAALDMASWLENQVEQKTVDKVEPKFKPGDKIVEKDIDECGSGTIKEIRDGKYIFEDNCFIYIKEQDLWQLVKEPVEPKFKVGDWCIDNEDNTIFQITKLLSNLYYYRTNEGKEYSCTRDSIERDAHLWTIQDAKDGDVLKEDFCLFIIERMKPDGTAIVHCCLFDDGDFDLVGSNLSFDVDSTYPATKEQRDLLFQKMNESGYEWDAEKKELKKIKQKSAWSEEDEKNFES